MDSYKDFAISLALEAGKIMRDNFAKGIERKWKEDKTPITHADQEINSLVLRSIKDKYPNHSILAEEESDLRNSDYIWVCDPIDGTVPFSHGFPVSVFTLALVHKDDVILGIIYDPYLDRLVVAEKGKGTFLNEKQVFVSKAGTVKNTVVDIETWSTAPYDLNFLYAKLTSQSCMVTTLRSTVYAGMLVAIGQLAGVYFGGKTPWDAAAVKIVVEEAGGRVTDLEGNDQIYNKDIHGFIASNGLVHDELLKLYELK